ncbi:Hypothetical protein, putative [Bodo saltans]|uniref:Uncharacterized protein n=2 Tax=Bodo saltans TaxID=75058 RepID=A0A0S4KLS6_BODSA|nr:Hypothetical protein, putative [Bodo saltans]|eukprot:CUI15366.1 Hypothetical protein, putative [Bodo saltans]
MFASLVAKYGPEPDLNDPALLAAAGGGAAAPTAPAAAAPVAAASADYRERLRRCYLKYAPDKIDSLDATLQKYAGKEEAMFASLVKKYGPEPAANDPAVIAASQQQQQPPPQQQLAQPSPASPGPASPGPQSPGFGSPASPYTPQQQEAPSGNAADYRERLRRYYMKYASDKIDSVDSTLPKYVGREEKMFEAFVAKYGPEPALNDPAVVAGGAAPPGTPGQVPPQQQLPQFQQQQQPPAAENSYRDRLRRFYETYAPEKVGNLEATLAKYAGKEEQMFQSLTSQFGPEPPATSTAGYAPSAMTNGAPLSPAAYPSGGGGYYVPLQPMPIMAPEPSSPARNTSRFPTAVFVSGVQEILQAYAPHASSALADQLLEAFLGREAELFYALCAHYDDIKTGLAVTDAADISSATLRASQGTSSVWVEAISCRLMAPGAGLSDVSLSLEVDDREVCAMRGGKEDVNTNTILWKEPSTAIAVFQASHFVGDATLVLKWRQAALGEVAMPLCLFTLPGKTTVNLKSVGRIGGSCSLSIRWMTVTRDVMNDVLRRLRLGASASSRTLSRRSGKGVSMNDVSTALKASGDDPWLQRIAAMYARYLPSDVSVVPDLREEYRGREQDLVDILSIRYGPEPFPSAFRTRVERIFLLHEPQRVRESLVFEAQAAGREEMTLRALTRKYGAESPILYSLPVYPTRAPHALTDPHRVRLTRWFVARYPKRVAQVEYFLARFYEREELLFRLMREVLGPEPVQGQREETLRSTTLSSPALRNFFNARKAPAFLQWMWRDTASETAASSVGLGGTNTSPSPTRGGGSPLAASPMPSTVGLGFTPHHLRIRKRLERFYEVHNPAKLSEVDSTLKQWEGRYELMFAALVQKYGPEPGNVGGPQQQTSTSPLRGGIGARPGSFGGEGANNTTSRAPSSSLGFLLGDRGGVQPQQRPVQDYSAWASPSSTILSPGRVR